MNNSPYLDKPFVPLVVALRSMLAETEAKIAKKRGCKRCCVTGLRRSQRSCFQLRYALIQIGGPALARTAASGSH
jgi:hypothetical protein